MSQKAVYLSLDLHYTIKSWGSVYVLEGRGKKEKENRKHPLNVPRCQIL